MGIYLIDLPLIGPVSTPYRPAFHKLVARKHLSYKRVSLIGIYLTRVE
jgi:hypothetical protein